MQQHHKKCICASHNGMACKTCSRIVMKFMTTNEYKNQTGIDYNPLVYCKIKRNNYHNNSIIKEMKEKLLNIDKYRHLASNSNWIIFYDNFTKVEIHRFKP